MIIQNVVPNKLHDELTDVLGLRAKTETELQKRGTLEGLLEKWNPTV